MTGRKTSTNIHAAVFAGVRLSSSTVVVVAKTISTYISVIIQNSSVIGYGKLASL